MYNVIARHAKHTEKLGWDRAQHGRNHALHARDASLAGTPHGGERDTRRGMAVWLW